MNCPVIMTPEQIDFIRRSFDRIWPVRRKLAGLFYSRILRNWLQMRTACSPLIWNDNTLN